MLDCDSCVNNNNGAMVDPCVCAYVRIESVNSDPHNSVPRWGRTGKG